MHASATQSLSAVLVAAMLPAVTAHMSMFHPSMYGFNSGDPETVYPLANKGFDQWWFRGQLRNPPRETMMLTPGTTQTVEITCGKWISSYGGGSNPNREACPNDQGSYHAGGQGWGGWGGNQESNLMGCALAIAYKADPWAVKPEDFIVMSVQENCVRQRDTPFEIPSNLPACPEGGCTCAWFWQGQNSAEEMYMTGFKCDVKGGAKTAIPQPRKPRQNGNSDAATQPYYWANHGAQNVDWQVGWTTRPKYNSKMGWKNGAQTRAFADAAPVQPPATSTTSTASTTTSRAQVNPPRPTQPVVDHLAADPQSSAAPSATTSPASTAAPGKQCKRKIHRRRRSRNLGAAQNH